MKSKEIKKLSSSEREKKLKELKMELVKAKANAAKGGSSKIKEIKKMIARMHTFNTKDKLELNNK